MSSTFDFLVRAQFKPSVKKEIGDGYLPVNKWATGYYFRYKDKEWEHFLFSSTHNVPIMIEPSTICRCSGMWAIDEFMGDRGLLFEGDIVGYREEGFRKSLRGWGVVRFGQFCAGGYGIEGDGFVDGVGWYIELTEPTIQAFRLKEYGETKQLMVPDENGELVYNFSYTGLDIFHHPEYLSKEVEDNNG